MGVNVSYPLIKRQADVTYVLEPLAQVVIAPNARTNPLIPDEDSESWTLDETNLFSSQSSPGSGPRRRRPEGSTWAAGRRPCCPTGAAPASCSAVASAAENQPAISLRTGLSTALSDYVIDAEATPVKGVNLFSRWRLDTDTFAINEPETGANFATSRIAGYISYLQEADARPAGSAPTPRPRPPPPSATPNSSSTARP